MSIVKSEDVIHDLIKECVCKLNLDFSEYVSLYGEELGKEVAEASWGGIALFNDASISIDFDTRKSFAEKVKNKDYGNLTLNDCVKALHNCGYTVRVITM